MHEVPIKLFTIPIIDMQLIKLRPFKNDNLRIILVTSDQRFLAVLFFLFITHWFLIKCVNSGEVLAQPGKISLVWNLFSSSCECVWEPQSHILHTNQIFLGFKPSSILKLLVVIHRFIRIPHSRRSDHGSLEGWLHHPMLQIFLWYEMNYVQQPGIHPCNSLPGRSHFSEVPPEFC